jgi:hypothetical protein
MRHPLGPALTPIRQQAGEQSANDGAADLQRYRLDDLWELAQARERLAEALARGGSSAAAALLKKASAD